MSAADVLAPIVILGGGAFLVYLVARSVTRANGALAALTAVIYGISLIYLLRLGPQVAQGRYPAWSLGEGEAATLQIEPGAFLVALVGIALGCLVAIFSGRYIALDHRQTEYYPLLLILSAGMVGMVMSVDLFTLYLLTMLTGGAAYALVAFRRRTETAIEAGFKYVILGSLGAMLMLAGIAYLFREGGTLSMPFTSARQGPWRYLGMALVLAGLGIKSALVPAHTWLPDAHGRAPSSVSALLSGIIVQAHLYVLVKAGLGIGWPARQLGWLLIILSLLNMTVGNALALVQTYGKRLLGYSSIVQVGYMMMALGLGLAYNRPELIAAALFLVWAHALTKGLAFLCKGVFHFYCNATTIEELHGMGRRLPVASACFVIALAGLAGVPPLVGFAAKWQTLLAALKETDRLIWFAVVAFLLHSLISLGYYLPLIGRVLSRPEGGVEPITTSLWMLGPIVILAFLALLMGVMPQPLPRLAYEAGRFLLAWGQGK